VTRLRKLMLEELQRRNYSESTIRGYLRAVQGFAKHFGKSPDKLGPEELRQYQVYLLRERKLTPGGVEARLSALRFLYVKTLKRHEMREHLPFPKVPRKLPVVMSQEEVAKVIDCARDLLQRTILMVLYSTGARRAELVRIKVADVDSQRMVIRIRHGKGGHDRDVPLSEKLLEALRQYWRWMNPRPGCFRVWPKADEWTDPCTTKPCGGRSSKPYNERACKSGLLRIPSGIVSQRICWKVAPT
jgi:integrase/recombinase XerD